MSDILLDFVSHRCYNSYVSEAREADTMKHKDVSKVKRGDVWVRPPIPPAVVVKVNRKTIDFYLPDGTEGYGNLRNVVEVLDNWKIRLNKVRLEEIMDACDFYFVSRGTR